MLTRASRCSLRIYPRPQQWSTALFLHKPRIPYASIRCLNTRKPVEPRRRRDSRSISTSPADISFIDNTHHQIPLLGAQDGQYPAGMALPGFMPLWDLSKGTILPIRDAMLGQSMDDSIKNLRACLTVGRFDRAEAILRKLAATAVFKVQEVQEINNTFLRSLVHAVFRGGDDVALKKLHTWFEVDMRQLNITPDATTLALMCRSAFALSHEKTRDRTIRRYLFIAEEMGLLEPTLASGEYLSEEFNMLCTIRDDIFNQQVPLEEVSSGSSYTSPAEKPPVALHTASQKGMGMKTLLQGIRSLYESNTVDRDLSDEERASWQISLEEDILEAELQRWRAEFAEMNKRGINPAISSKSMGALLWTWQVALKDEIKKHLKKIQASNTTYLTGDGPYLEQIGPEKLAALTILETIKTLSMEGVGHGANVYTVTGNIGDALELESWLIAQNNQRASRTKQKNQARRAKMLANMRKKGRSPNNADLPSVHKQNPVQTRERRSNQWPKVAKLRSSAFLLSKLIQVSKFTEHPHKSSRPIVNHRPQAFSHATLVKRGRRFGIIQVHPEFAKQLTRDPPAANLAHQLPMISKPEPWSDFRGAYLRYPAPLMRLRDPSGISDLYMDASIQEGNLEKVFKGLNILGKTEWRINRPVFDVMAEVWNTGEAITNFPPDNPQLVLPPEPEESADVATKYKWRKECKRLRNEHSGFHSNRCFLNLQMEVARAFLGHTFYLPHNMDFRGRAYPVGGIFQHMGADNARALFQFAKGKPLGDLGLFWLKVHLANTFGFDKASLADRAKFTDDHLADIRDSVTNPMNGKRWWLKAEDPWQCLACCHEIVGALDSPDPTKFVSHTPVHQDGTCNGLQHYAALGGDELGATQVNLIRRDKPADIYSEVARLVREDIEQDEADGNPMAKALHGHIARKVVKQPVMTYAYGVTFYGARAQIQTRLDEIIQDLPSNEFPNSQLALYITEKVFTHFGSLFSGATKIQHWLAECAARISSALSPEQIEILTKEDKEAVPSPPTKKTKSSTEDKSSASSKKTSAANKVIKDPTLKFQSGVVWTTPLKLPVVQPYRVIDSTKDLITSMQAFKLVCPSSNDTVHRRKQMAGFPPNFIHSLDATHMLMSALKCDEAGLTFAMVHDSFWTHAADIPTMSQALRQTFIDIHSEDITGRLAEEFNARYNAYMWRRDVPVGSPLANRILKLRRDWRVTMWKAQGGRLTPLKDKLALHELRVEYERIRLLRSTNEDDRQRGKNMVTPGSLYEEVESRGNTQDLVPVTSAQIEPEIDAEMEASDLEAEHEPEHEENILSSEEPEIEHHTQTTHTLPTTEDLLTSAIAPEQESELDPLPHNNIQPEAEPEAEPEQEPHKYQKPKRKTPAKIKPRAVKFWVPLSFPAVPTKGSFDVEAVRESTYFFS